MFQICVGVEQFKQKIFFKFFSEIWNNEIKIEIILGNKDK